MKHLPWQIHGYERAEEIRIRRRFIIRIILLLIGTSALAYGLAVKG